MDFQQQKLTDLQDELEARCRALSMSDDACISALDLALRISPEYATNENFRRQFLRVSEWDHAKTIVRLERHFETKLELFGSSLLCKDVTQADLGPGTPMALNGGWLQESPSRDLTGRQIFLMVSGHSDDVVLESKLRRFFYSVMIHAGSADVKGRVLIVWVSNDTIEATKEALMNAVQMFSAMPFILSDIHICVIGGQATTHMKPSLISQFELRIEMTKAVRVNSHHGTLSEVRQSLQEFGIPSSALPITYDGNLLYIEENRMKWDQRRVEEQQHRQKHGRTNTGHGDTSNPSSNLSDIHDSPLTDSPLTDSQLTNTFVSTDSDDLDIVMPVIDEPTIIPETDEIIARDMAKLSVKEREKALNDLHAVSDDSPRDPPVAVVLLKLEEMQRVLDTAFPNSESDQENQSLSAYEMARKMDSNYVIDEKLRMMFLRASKWNPSDAAVRFGRHFEIKFELFGPSLLCQDIIQDDLDPVALKALYDGWMQPLPLRDMAGRPLHFQSRYLGKDVPLKSKLQRFYYSIMFHGSDEVNGRVVILWINTDDPAADGPGLWQINRLITSMPIHLSAVHICLVGNGHNLIQQSIASVIRVAMGWFIRLRIKTHYGNPVQIKTSLQAYGIPATLVPVSDDGKILTAANSVMWAQVRVEERERRIMNAEENRRGLDNIMKNTQEYKVDTASVQGAPKAVRVGIPGNDDVLLGRGRLCREHVGNIRFRILIEKHQDAYNTASLKRQKMSMAAEIVKIVKSRNGRFLKEEGSGWSEVDDGVAKSKVATCFRTMRHRRKKMALIEG